jgi:Protein of unknown function (DUF3365)
MLVFAGASVTGLSSDAAPNPAMTWVDAADPASKTIRQTGEQLINQIGHQLIYEIEHALNTKGAPASIDIAHLKDFALPEPARNQPRVTALKLTSLNLRNMANKPDEDDREALNRIVSALNNGDEVPTVLVQKITHPSASTEWRVYRPITTMPLCLKCHGKSATLAPEVRARLDEKYPTDSAIDYSAYEWRGVIRVSLTNEPKPTKKK